MLVVKVRRLEAEDEPSNSVSMTAASNSVIPVRSAEKAAMRFWNCFSVSELVENRAISYCVRNSSAASGGLIRLNSPRRVRYSLKPWVAGLCNSATILASGKGVILLSKAPFWRKIGSSGARLTAFASIRFGSSTITR